VRVRVRRWLALAAVVLLATVAGAARDGPDRVARPLPGPAGGDALATPWPHRGGPAPVTERAPAAGFTTARRDGDPQRSGLAEPVVPAGGGYFPLPPATLVDAARLGPGATLTFTVTGPLRGGRPSSGVPAGGASAVAVSVVAGAPTASGQLALFPAGPPLAGATAVAFAAGRTTAGFATVEVPSGGRLAVRNSAGTTTVTVRVRGYWAAPCWKAGAAYVPAAPAELLRRALGPGQVARFRPADQRFLSATGVAAVALEVTVSAPTASGSLEIGRDGAEAGAAGPAVAFQRGRDASNFELAPVPADGRLAVRNSAGTTTVTVRLRGWYTAPWSAVRGSAFVPATAGRVLDAVVPAGGQVAFTTAAAGLPDGRVAAVALAVLTTPAAPGGPPPSAAAARGAGAEPEVAASYTVEPVGPGGRVAVAGPPGARVAAWLRGWYGAAAPLVAVPDSATAHTFGRASDSRPGWTGGDGSYPVRLPDGRTAWLFGDSFVGTAAPASTRPARTRPAGVASGLVRNAIVVQDGTRLTTLHGPVDPVSRAPRAFLRPAHQPGAWYWPASGFVEDGLVRVLAHEFRSGAKPDGFEWTGRNRIVTLGLPGLAQHGDAPVYGRADGSEVQWGVAVLEEADSTYLYGVRDLGGAFHVKHTHLARFPRGGSHGFWQFWDGAGWSPSPWASAALTGAPGPAGPLPLTGIAGSVVKVGASYLLLAIPDFGTAIEARLSCSPVGPWGPPRRLYDIPELHRPTGDRAYLARAYPDGDGLLVAYSLGPGSPDGDFSRASYYRPRYVRVRFRS